MKPQLNFRDVLGLNFEIQIKEKNKKERPVDSKPPTVSPLVPKLPLKSIFFVMSPRKGDVMLPPSVCFTVRTNRSKNSETDSCCSTESYLKNEVSAKDNDSGLPSTKSPNSTKIPDVQNSLNVCKSIRYPSQLQNSPVFLGFSYRSTTKIPLSRDDTPTPTPSPNLSLNEQEAIQRDFATFMKQKFEKLEQERKLRKEMLKNDSVCSTTRDKPFLIDTSSDTDDEKSTLHTSQPICVESDSDIFTADAPSDDNTSQKHMNYMNKAAPVRSNNKKKKSFSSISKIKSSTSFLNDNLISSKTLQVAANTIWSTVTSFINDLASAETSNDDKIIEETPYREHSRPSLNRNSKNKPLDQQRLSNYCMISKQSSDANQCQNAESFSKKKLKQAILSTQMRKNKPETLKNFYKSNQNTNICPATNMQAQDTENSISSISLEIDQTKKQTLRQQCLQEEILQEAFDTLIWKEPEIKPIKRRMSQPTIWQKIWNTIDFQTLAELKRRHHSLVIREGQEAITRQKWNPLLHDVSKNFWRNAAFSHIELSLCSVQNVPYIAQVIVETGNLRICMPFNCFFLRLPYLGDDQIIRIWCNSPATTSQRDSFNPVTGFDGGVTNWMECNYVKNDNKLTKENYHLFTDQIDLINDVDEDEFDEVHLQDIVDSYIHPRSTTFVEAAYFKYTPSDDFKTFFKLDIPVKSLRRLKNTLFEGEILLDPKGTFHECHREYFPEAIFDMLCDSAKIVNREPSIKLRTVLREQGTATLVTTGDVGENHVLSLPPCERNTKFLYKKLVYVSYATDTIDILVGEILNRNNQTLLNQIGPNRISRLSKGMYNIDNEEYIIRETVISPKSFPDFDFTHYPEITSSAYAIGFTVPLVCTEDSYQPLLDFLLNTKKNNKWISVEKLQTPYSKYGVTMLKDQALLSLLDQTTFNFDEWDKISIPPNLNENPVNVQKLYIHSRAIKLNIILTENLQSFDKKKLLPSFLEDLKPPQLIVSSLQNQSQQCYTLSSIETLSEIPVIVPIKRNQDNYLETITPSFLIPFFKNDSARTLPIQRITCPKNTTLNGNYNSNNVSILKKHIAGCDKPPENHLNDHIKLESTLKKNNNFGLPPYAHNGKLMPSSSHVTFVPRLKLKHSLNEVNELSGKSPDEIQESKHVLILNNHNPEVRLLNDPRVQLEKTKFSKPLPFPNVSNNFSSDNIAEERLHSQRFDLHSKTCERHRNRLITNSPLTPMDFIQTNTNKEFPNKPHINNPHIYRNSSTNTSHHNNDSQHTNTPDDYQDNLFMKTPPRSQNYITTNNPQRVTANPSISTPLKFENNLKVVDYKKYKNNVNKNSLLICTVDSPSHSANEYDKYNQLPHLQTPNPQINIANYKKYQIDQHGDSAAKFSINSYKSIPQKSFENLQTETLPKQLVKINKNSYKDKTISSQTNGSLKFETKSNTCMPQKKNIGTYTTLHKTHMDFFHECKGESYQSNPIGIFSVNNNTQYNKTKILDNESTICSRPSLSKPNNSDGQPKVQLIQRQNPYYQFPRAQTQLWNSNTSPSEKIVNNGFFRRTTLCEGHLNNIAPVHLPKMVLGYKRNKETEFSERLLPKSLRYHTSAFQGH